jgi:hypothetical protein
MILRRQNILWQIHTPRLLTLFSKLLQVSIYSHFKNFYIFLFFQFSDYVCYPTDNMLKNHALFPVAIYFAILI